MILEHEQVYIPLSSSARDDGTMPLWALKSKCLEFLPRRAFPQASSEVTVEMARHGTIAELCTLGKQPCSSQAEVNAASI